MKIMRHLMEELMISTQKKICTSLSDVNEKSSESHPWTSEHGEGTANVFSNGGLLEKGGVNVSKMHGKIFGNMHKTLPPELQVDPTKLKYFATGMSIVLHPLSPMIPTIHANYRYFEIEDENGHVIARYFGGGTDLTPYYLFEEDAVQFHQTLKEACDKTEPRLYQKLKKEADDYFYLPHRKEHRGIGGIFSLRMADKPAEQIYEWVRDCCEAFSAGYLPIVERHKRDIYSPEQKKWQLIRRGRYVEFNLLYDAGTHFGIKAGGNIENILMSLPPNVSWEFNHQPLRGSEEEKLLKVIKNPKDWV